MLSHLLTAAILLTAVENPSAPTESDTSEVQEELPEVVAKVGDQVITGEEFQRDLRYRYALIKRQEPGREIDAEQFRRDTLDKLVKGMVLRQLAVDSLVSVTDAEVDATLAEGREPFPTAEAYQEHLDNLGYTEEELRQELRMNLLTERFLERKMAQVVIPLDEIKKRFDVLAEQGATVRPQRTADVRHILVAPDADSEESWADAEARVKELRDRVTAGEDFGALAEELSDDLPSRARGGLYREATEDTMPAAIGEVMRTLEAGVISEPVKSPLGWHIVRVEKRYGAGPMTFDQARERIREVIEDEKRAEVIQRLVEEARPNMEIELYP
jgi:parvulin-like peptidyl-prolyl isomerase